MLPALLTLLPSIVRMRPLLSVHLLVDFKVILLMVELTSWITADAEPVPVIKTLLLLVGTPADQLPPLLQRPVPAPLVNVSLVMMRGAVFVGFVWPRTRLDAEQSRATRTKPANKDRSTFPQNGVVLIDSPLRFDRLIFEVTGKPEAVPPPASSFCFRRTNSPEPLQSQGRPI